MQMNTQAWAWSVACLLIVGQTGCTSALTASYLRNGLWERDEQAAPTGDAASEDRDAPSPPPDESAAASPEADRERREAALEEAMARLSKLGTLDPAVEAALVATLQRTQPEDWPVVVDEFATSLPAPHPTPPAEQPAPEPAAAVATDETPPVAEVAANPSQAVEATDNPTDPQPEEAASAAVDAAAAAPPAFAVRSACFASAVRAWGEVDRFTADRFRPGQEVIVYVELENLAAGESPAGHTTCIDAALRLVDAADRTLHAWTFEPVAETSTGRRHDYFARYIVRIPDAVPAGDCRVEVAVTDTLAGTTATTTLPLEITPHE